MLLFEIDNEEYVSLKEAVFKLYGDRCKIHDTCWEYVDLYYLDEDVIVRIHASEFLNNAIVCKREEW